MMSKKLKEGVLGGMQEIKFTPHDRELTDFDKWMKIAEDWGYLPPQQGDREYGNREHEGLEGPFTQRNGKVLYYDRKDGNYYDPDTDHYVDHDDYERMNDPDNFPLSKEPYENVDEKAPEGWEGTVKSMKKHKEIDNPWALANYMKDKGYKSHKESANESKKLKEGVLGGMQAITPVERGYTEDEFSKWMRIVNEAENGTTNLNECKESLVQGDYSNGYGREYKTSNAYSDFFPSGADSNVVKHVSPSNQGDNPMQKAVKDNKKDEVNEAYEKDRVHKELVHAYRNFLGEAETKNKELNKRASNIGKKLKGSALNEMDPNLAANKAALEINGRWPEMEPVIASSPQAAVFYAKNVIKGRWPEAEETIRKDPNSAAHYVRYVLKGNKWPSKDTI